MTFLHDREVDVEQIKQDCRKCLQVLVLSHLLSCTKSSEMYEQMNATRTGRAINTCTPVQVPYRLTRFTISLLALIILFLYWHEIFGRVSRSVAANMVL